MKILPLFLLLLLSVIELSGQVKPTFFNEEFKKVKEKKGFFVTQLPFEAKGRETLLLTTISNRDSLLVTFLDGKFVSKEPYTTPQERQELNFNEEPYTTPEKRKDLNYFEEAGEKIFEMVDVAPTPKGGLEALYRYMGQNMRYPSEAIRANQQGRVYVEFIVTKEGKVEGASVVKGVSPSLDAAALRIIQEAGENVGWEPGFKDGQAVHTRMVMPIIFGHNGLKKKKN